VEPLRTVNLFLVNNIACLVKKAFSRHIKLIKQSPASITFITEFVVIILLTKAIDGQSNA